MTEAPPLTPETLTVAQVTTIFQQNFHQRCVLSDMSELLQRSLPPNNQVVLAAMQKSGSTFLHNVLGEVLQRPINLTCYNPDEAHKRSMYLPFAIRDTLYRTTVSRAHMPATPTNIEMMRAFNTTPIVLVRDLFDVVVSSHDATARRLYAAQGASRGKFPSFGSDDRASQIDQIIDMNVPEFIQLYVSWSQAEKEKSIDFKWVTYDKLLGDKPGTISAILEFLQLPQPMAAIIAALEKIEGKPSETLKNKATTGRGRDQLSDEQIERITAMTRHFPWVDFERVGIKQACLVS